MIGKTVLLVAGLLAFAEVSQAASTARCGRSIVSTGDSAFEVSRKCGEPAAKSKQGIQRIPGQGRGFTEVPVEEWVYGPENGMYQYLKFQGDRLVRIESRRNN